MKQQQACRSMLTHGINDTLNLVTLQSQIISGITSNVTAVQIDLGVMKTQLQSLSSLYNATIHDTYTTRAAIKWNMSQLHDLIHEVERNHSTILVELFRILGEAAESRSVLTHGINDTLNLVTL